MIEPGQILDKYELIEKVGQGGMAVVYRGLDRSLKREVAVKVLHQHLADHPEARNRFEREAQAVAKLRHENILEIFDYSGVDSDESYIVTEFIDGQTLKEFVSKRAIAYPETAAMIAAQVCRALAHAHGLGILHRDIKPENIMIRSDGVLKLMDFGIAQMLDTDRLTMTGQLLGSPAYMSPEHVEGKPLDVRTDVFSVGILLYQLTTGELPFKGRNPHEILKRIAECEYAEPRTLNPKIGKQLTRIIKRAMAREKEDRYASVNQMLSDLEEFLDGSGLPDTRPELARFFASPASYEIALRARLVSTLTRQGREALADNKAKALEYFDRVLTIDPDNADVLAEIDRMSKRQRGVRIAALFGGIAALAGVAYLGQRAFRGGEERAAPIASVGADAAPADAQLAVAAPPDASVEVVEVSPDASAAAVAVARVRKNDDRHDEPRGRGFDAGPAGPASRLFELNVFPRQNAEYRVDDGAWQPWTEVAPLDLGPGPHVVQVRNPCCQTTGWEIAADAPGRQKTVTTPYYPAVVTAKCERPGAKAQLDGVPLPLGRARPIPIESANGTRTVEVMFITETGAAKQEVKVKYREHRTVECE